MSSIPAWFDDHAASLRAGTLTLSELEPLVDGAPVRLDAVEIQTTSAGWQILWSLDVDQALQTICLRVTPLPADDGLKLELVADPADHEVRVQSIGIRIGDIAGLSRYLRNGNTSWDGSYFVDVNAPVEAADADLNARTGYAMTALVGAEEQTVVAGFLRHDRFQGRLRFSIDHPRVSIDLETLLDGVSFGGSIAGEAWVFIAGTAVEETLRRWARLVAAASPTPPRVRSRRITGWCSWYNLYASISEAVLLEHLQAAARFRDTYGAPFEVFQIDDGFTPEMGDWLQVKPQFPRGMAPLLADIAAAGFVPGLWIAPFMVGNRSHLFADHPDWVVIDRVTGHPLAPMKFYGEFRWHKRSEEYYILDITVPAAEQYIRNVLRVWTRSWGCQYLKTDFMYFGSEFGPDRALWHEAGLSRMQVWMRMARLIREEIGEALWLGCGGPIWAPVGLMDAVRIGRDIGVSWKGQQSAQSLLRDQTTRNFANGILWQADPDCVLLRDRFHDLTDMEVRALATFAACSGGLLMTSDQLDEVPEERRQLLADLLGDGSVQRCDFPNLGSSDPVLLQHVPTPSGALLVNVFNTSDLPLERQLTPGTRVTLAPHEARLICV